MSQNIFRFNSHGRLDIASFSELLSACVNLGSSGRAIAQAVNRWLPTAATRVRPRSGHVGFVAAKVALGQVFSEYFGFAGICMPL
jgi:hypothetical protein